VAGAQYRLRTLGGRSRSRWTLKKQEKKLDTVSGAFSVVRPDARQNARCGPPEGPCSRSRTQHDSGEVRASPRASEAVSRARKTAWYKQTMIKTDLSCHARPPRRRIDQPHDRQTPGAAPDGGEPSDRARGGAPQEDARSREDRGQPRAQTGRGGLDP